jgi:RNA-binding protein 39
MFDPATETSSKWVADVRADVIDECSRYGKVVHVYVDKKDPGGNVYVKCDGVASAIAAVNALHGRWFGGRGPGTIFTTLHFLRNL